MRDLPSDSPLHALAAAAGAQIDDLLAPVVPDADRVDRPRDPRCRGGYYEWYYAYGRLLRPATILEIGVLGGGSVASLAIGTHEGQRDLTNIWLVDDRSHDGGSSAVALSTVADRVRRVVPGSCIMRTFEEDSQRLAALLPGPLFDVISIDADHRIGPCYHDLRISLPRLAPDGHILVDDAQWTWVRDAVDAFVADHPHLDDLFVATMTGTRILHLAGEHLDRCPLLAGTRGTRSEKDASE